MKTNKRLVLVVMMVLGGISSFGQANEPEVPGDHFSLEGALELFKKSASPQEFEKMLNSPDTKVNNLDLNGDGYIDYIRVLDRYEGNVHAFILQAVISDHESQDVAVIELEKLSNGKAVLQIVGDEDIYGVTTIIEPTREVRTYAGARTSNTVVNVWTWPSVQYVYSPSYTVWVSPWGWHRRPVWYRAWRPVAYVHYYPIWRPYRPYYVTCHTRRVVYAHEIYRPHRTTSVVVRKRYNDRIVRYRSEHRDAYKNSRTRDDRRFADNNRSSTGVNGGRRTNDADLHRRSSNQRESVASPTRPTTRERSASTELRRNTDLRRGDSPDNAARIPRDTRPDASGPSVNESRSPEPAKVQRPATSERSAPAIQRQPEIKRDASRDRRSETASPSPQIRQQVSRPSVQRSQPAPVQRVQKPSVTRERTTTSPAPRSVRQPASRPASVNTNRSSSSPAVQQRTPSRQSGATRSADVRRGRQ